MKTVIVPFLILFLFACISDLPAQTVTTLYTFNGLAPGDNFGRAVAGAGDVDKDGYPDLIVGAPGASPGWPFPLTGAGQATVLSGRDGKVIHTFAGLFSGDDLGTSVAGAGDVNRDGYADLIVGAPGASPSWRHSGVGQAFVYSGMDGSILHTFNTPLSKYAVIGNSFGHSVAGVGDLNKDGYADVIVGVRYAVWGGNSGAGIAIVYSGVNGDILYVFGGLTSTSHFGTSVAGAGDVNKDGYPDFIVGARNADPPGGAANTGEATVFSGKDGKILYTFNNNGKSPQYFGQSVAGAGDVNRDGYADLIVGDYRSSASASRAGQAYVFSGQNGSTLHIFSGALASDYLGMSVAGAGDVDKDGHADLLVGAYGADPGTPARSAAGQVYVFSGQTGSTLYTFDGVLAGDYLGYSVAGPGDVNKDGFPDLLVGAYGADPGNTSAGTSYVFSVARTDISGTGSTSIGGTINLRLLAPGDGNLPYQVASSLGTGPIPIDTRTLGLSPDALMFISISGTLPSIFSKYSGTLDGSGQGTAAINIPQNLSLVGIRINSAFVTISATAPSGIKSISNTFSFTITK